MDRTKVHDLAGTHDSRLAVVSHMRATTREIPNATASGPALSGAESWLAILVALPIAVLAVFIFSAPTQAVAADAFRRLTDPQIRSRIIGNVVTDESHWSDRFDANGTLSAMELGRKKPGNWKLKANEMCVTRMARKAVEECFEIWQSGDQIDYRRDGVILTSGVLRRE